MNPKKFLELRNAKSLAILIAVTTIILYITRNLDLASRVLMVFLGLSALIKVKVGGTKLREKKAEIKKGIYFSVGGIFLGLVIKKIIESGFILGSGFAEFDFTVEVILLLLVVLVLKEVYSQKKEKWENSFVLMASFLFCSGILLLFIEVLHQTILI